MSLGAIRSSPPKIRASALRVLRKAPKSALRGMVEDWSFWARPDQLPPPGEWRTWLMLGGRGAGKTRAGAEWVRREVESERRGRIALIGPAFADVREVMIDGPSGLLSISAGPNRPEFQPSRRRLLWPNGAVAYAFSAEDPDALRGPQFDGAWLDELAAWREAQAALDVLQFGLRLGVQPRQTITTTPRSTEVLRRVIAAHDTAVTRATTMANADFLAPEFAKAIHAAYGRSLLGRQELFGELVDVPDGGFWSRELIERASGRKPAMLDEIVVGVDPPAGDGRDAAGCGVIVVGAAGQGRERRVWVLGDRSVQGARPDAWARRVVETARAFEADRIVAEVNQGGAMVRTLLRFVDPTIAVKEVRATLGKRARAEPVLLLYEQGVVKHAGSFPLLEDEMCAFGSPEGSRCDRVDALVWAVTAVMGGTADPRLRRL